MESPTIRSGTQFLEILCETRDATQLGDTRESLKMYFSSEMNEITVSVTLDRQAYEWISLYLIKITKRSLGKDAWRVGLCTMGRRPTSDGAGACAQLQECKSLVIIHSRCFVKVSGKRIIWFYFATMLWEVTKGPPHSGLVRKRPPLSTHVEQSIDSALPILIGLSLSINITRYAYWSRSSQCIIIIFV